MTSALARNIDQPSDYIESSGEKFNQQNRENVELVAGEVVVRAGGIFVRHHSGATVTVVERDSTTENRQDTDIKINGCVSEVCEKSVSRTFEKNYKITAKGNNTISASKRLEEIGINFKKYMAPYIQTGYVDASTVVGADLRVATAALGLGLLRVTSAICGVRSSLVTVVLDKHPMRKFANHVERGAIRHSNVKSEMRVAGTHLRAWYIFGPRNKKPGYVAAMIEKEEELMKKKEQASSGKGQIVTTRTSDSVIFSEGSSLSLEASDDILAQTGHYEFSPDLLSRAADSVDDIYSTIDDPLYEAVDDIVLNSTYESIDDIVTNSTYEAMDDIVLNSTYESIDDIVTNSTRIDFADDVLGQVYDTPINALSTKGGSGVYDTPISALSTKGGGYYTPMSSLESSSSALTQSNSEVLAASYMLPMPSASSGAATSVSGVTGTNFFETLGSTVGGSPPIPGTFDNLQPDMLRQTLNPVPAELGSNPTETYGISSEQIQQTLMAGTESLPSPDPLADLHLSSGPSARTISPKQQFPMGRNSDGFVYLRILMAEEFV